MGDLEAFGRFEYGKMEFLSPSRRLRPRSPSPSRLPLSFRRMRYLYARICLLVVGFPFMFSTLEKVCTSLFAQGLLTYVVSLVEWLPFVPGPSPLRQPQFLPWELNGSRTEFGEQHDDHNESTTTPEMIRAQEDEVGIRRLRHMINTRVVNETIIIIPVSNKDMVWVDNLACRKSSLNMTNMLYWAMDGLAARQLQLRRQRFYYNPLLDAEQSQTQLIDLTKHKLCLWIWVLRTGTNMLSFEPTVAVFKNPCKFSKWMWISKLSSRTGVSIVLLPP